MWGRCFTTSKARGVTVTTGFRIDCAIKESSKNRDGNSLAGPSVMRILLIVVFLAIGTGCRTNETPEQQVKDAKITADVKSKLAGELGASTLTNISVNSTNGVVTLAGTVHDPTEKSRAVAIAQAVPNVAGVNDDLQMNTH